MTTPCIGRVSRETTVRVVDAIHELHDLPDGVLASAGERMTGAVLDTLLALLHDESRFTIIDIARYSGHDVTQVSAVIAALGAVAAEAPEFAPYAKVFAVPDYTTETNSTRNAPPQPARPTPSVKGEPSPDDENEALPFSATERASRVPENAEENTRAEAVPETDSSKRPFSPGGCGIRCGIVTGGLLALLAYALVRTLKPS